MEINKTKYKIGIQGVKASFHDVAAHEFFELPFDVVECSTFPKLFQSLDQGICDYAVMAIENALAGSILPNYQLMEKYQVNIIGEVYIKIKMNLLALPGEKIDKIKIVMSHPMAIHQCEDFLLKYPNIKIQEHADTAESAFEIQKNNLKGYASIASLFAAKTYGLDVLAEGIETNKSNFTRFLILTKKIIDTKNSNRNKSTLSFITGHHPGSLVQVLNLFEKYKINLTKIQSLPIVGRPYHYAFHVDLMWDHFDDCLQCLKEVSSKVESLSLFGHYLAGGRPNL